MSAARYQFRYVPSSIDELVFTTPSENPCIDKNDLAHTADESSKLSPQETKLPIWQQDQFLQHQRIRCVLGQYDWKPTGVQANWAYEMRAIKPASLKKHSRNTKHHVYAIPLNPHLEPKNLKSKMHKREYFAPTRRKNTRQSKQLATPTPRITRSNNGNTEKNFIPLRKPGWKKLPQKSQQKEQAYLSFFPSLSRNNGQPQEDLPQVLDYAAAVRKSKR